jgi:hypothetical protein
MRVTLGLIGVEDGRVRALPGDGGHFPRQIGDIAQAMAHALPEEGRGLMRGIARQKDIPHLPLMRHQPVEAIGRGAHDLMRHALHPWLDQRRDGFGLHHRTVILAGQQHELPAAMVAATGHHRGGAFGIAHHHRQALQIGSGRHAADRGEADRALDLGIDHQPGFLEIEIVERDAQGLAHRAARSVAGDHPAGRQGLVLAILRIGDVDGAILLAEAGEFRAQLQLDMAHACKALAQMGFQLGLIEEVIVGPAEGPGHAHRAHIADHLSRSADMQMPVGIGHIAQHPVDHPADWNSRIIS